MKVMDLQLTCYETRERLRRRVTVRIDSVNSLRKEVRVEPPIVLEGLARSGAQPRHRMEMLSRERASPLTPTMDQHPPSSQATSEGV